MGLRLLASGEAPDLSSGTTLTPTFIECDSAQFTATDILQIAGGAQFAVLCNNGKLFVSGSGFLRRPYILRSIYLCGDAIYGIDATGRIYDVLNDRPLFDCDGAISVCASSTIRVVCHADGLFAAGPSEPLKKISDGAVAVGCTATSIFAATTDNRLQEWREDTWRDIAVIDPIVAVACNDDDAYFLDQPGKLFKLFEGKLVRVDGLPLVTTVAVGVQHCAAITVDRRLFVWGFNPSGQLGIGADRHLTRPVCVLTGVRQVACGAQFTCVIADPATPQDQPVDFATPQVPFSEWIGVE
jgi:hypothetical protein